MKCSLVRSSVLLLFVVSCAVAERQRLSADFDWKFIQADVSGAEALGFDDASWRSLNVPHDWSIEGEYSASANGGGKIGYLPTGVGWYRKNLAIPPAWQGQHVSIQFDGVFRKSTVYADGAELGHRPYGYISFAYDLTDHIAGKTNLVIAVRVDNSLQPAARWYTGSGIYGHVWTSVANKVHVDRWGTQVVSSYDGSDATVDVETRMVNQHGATTNVSCQVELYDAAGTLVGQSSAQTLSVSPGGTNTFSQQAHIPNPDLWSPGSPNLYTVHSVLKAAGVEIDRYETTIGVRTLAWDRNSGFELNGEPLKIHGMCNHWAHGPLGAAVPDAVVRNRLQMLKDMGANAVRTSHYPRPPIFYELCDRIGLMVMDEIFDGWKQKAAQDYGALDFNDWWETDITDWLMRDRNHPSVILWSLGNETSGSTAAANMLAVCHAMDPSRLVTSGSSNEEMMDVYGENGATERINFTSNPSSTAPFIGTECTHSWMARGVYRTQTWYRDGYNATTVLETPNLTPSEIFTYDWAGSHTYKRAFNSSYDNAYVRDNIRHFQQKVQESDWLSGAFRWTGFDYLGEADYIYGGWPFRLFSSGVIDVAGFPKDACYLYQSLWTDGNESPMIHILPSWTHPVMVEGTEVPVAVYSNCEEVRLYKDGGLLGTKALGGLDGGWDQMAAEWLVQWLPGTLRAEGYIGGTKVVEKSIETADLPACIQLESNNTNLLADARDMAEVVVSINDTNHVFYPYGENRVWFELFGPATLKSVGNGGPTDTDPHRADNRRAFMGKAKAFVESTTDDGEILLLAAAILGERRQITSDRVSIHVDQLALRGAPANKTIAIYYTVDGSEPDDSSTPYTESFSVNLGTTVKAAIYADGAKVVSCEELFDEDEGLYWGAPAISAVGTLYQAEDADSAGAAVAASGSGWKGTGFLDFSNGEGFIEWSVTTDGDDEEVVLAFHYAGADPDGGRPMRFEFNGERIDDALEFPNTGDWDTTWATVRSTRKLKNGSNLIRLSTSGQSGMNFDQLEVIYPSTGPYEAEDAALSGPVVKTGGSGWTGSGFADFSSSEGSITWMVYASQPGDYEIQVRYTSGDSNRNRPMDLTINGTTVATDWEFPSSGGWTSSWTTQSSEQHLQAGNNTILLETTGQSGVNIDSLDVVLVRLDIPPPSTYGNYVQTAFAGNSGADTNLLGDAEGDGLLNIWEYMQLTDPLASNDSPFGIFLGNDGEPRLWYRRNTQATDYAISIQSSATPTQWIAAAYSEESTAPDGAAQEVVVKPASTNEPALMFRLQLAPAP
ncbi:glycoside hydrolase family 2 TIM barrel-domain containing protein [Pontiella desulfatans]|nr:glycoside hydrolase family 2 TIM barrel-domain containing protein [Pontiella desulfatans]